MAEALFVGSKLRAVSRMSPRVKQETEELLLVLNTVDVAEREWLPEGWSVPYYTLERVPDREISPGKWQAGSYSVVANWLDGGREAGFLIVCEACGWVQELFDGQVESCWNCGAE